jgi:hypothetical protein
MFERFNVEKITPLPLLAIANGEPASSPSKKSGQSDTHPNKKDPLERA